MSFQNTIALVTGANRGIGRSYVDTLLKHGAKKIYATARKRESLNDLVALGPDRVIPLELDVTKPDQIKRAAELADDVNLLINNAGVLTNLGGNPFDNLEGFRIEAEVNVFGLYSLTSAFLPALRKQSNAAIVNVASIASFTNFPLAPTYSATKAAVYSLTQGFRTLLAPEGIRVIGVFPGPIDTDMAAEIELEKTPPSEVAEETLAAIEHGNDEVFPDPFAQETHRQWQTDARALEAQFAQMVNAPQPASVS